MGRVVNYGQLSNRAKHKLKQAGYTEDSGGKTASRSSKKRKKRKSKSPTSAEQHVINWGNVAIDKAVARQRARYSIQANKPPTVSSAARPPTGAWTPNMAGMPEGLGVGAGAAQTGDRSFWDRVKDTMMTIGQAANPWSQKRYEPITANVKNPLGKAALEYMANKPFSTALVGTGVSTALARAKLAEGSLANIKNIVRPGKLAQTTLDGSKGFVVNTKTVGLVSKILTKKFSLACLSVAGAYAGATFFGMWGQAEAPESPSIISSKFLVPNALETGDWSLAIEAEEAMEELADLDWWEKIVMWTPVSPAVGVVNKIKGIKEGIGLLKKYRIDAQWQQATGETDDEKYARIRQEEIDQQQEITDYRNAERKKMFDYEQEARAAAREATSAAEKEAFDYELEARAAAGTATRAAQRGMFDYELRKRAAARAATRAAEIKARNADAAFWAKEAAKQREYEAADMRAQAKFWSEYKKLTYKLDQEKRPSQLNFGIL